MIALILDGGRQPFDVAMVGEPFLHVGVCDPYCSLLLRRFGPATGK